MNSNIIMHFAAVFAFVYVFGYSRACVYAPDEDEPFFMQCAGSHVTEFPYLSDTAKSTLKEIIIFETFIIKLPTLQGMEYPALEDFTEFDNIVLDCDSLRTWVLFQVDTVFSSDDCDLSFTQKTHIEETTTAIMQSLATKSEDSTSDTFVKTTDEMYNTEQTPATSKTDDLTSDMIVETTDTERSHTDTTSTPNIETVDSRLYLYIIGILSSSFTGLIMLRCVCAKAKKMLRKRRSIRHQHQAGPYFTNEAVDNSIYAIPLDEITPGIDEVDLYVRGTENEANV